MSIDERHRLKLHDAARTSWGSDVASTLMEMLPPTGWGDVATSRQLAALEARIDERFTRIDERFDGVYDHFATMERQLRSDLRGDLNEAILRTQRWTVATVFGSSAIVVAAFALFSS